MRNLQFSNFGALSYNVGSTLRIPGIRCASVSSALLSLLSSSPSRPLARRGFFLLDGRSGRVVDTDLYSLLAARVKSSS